MTDASQRRALLGLIGAPIHHSAAPLMHEAAGESCHIRVHYQLIEVPGANRNMLQALLQSLRWMEFDGVNVTFPYKEAVVPLLDALDDAARTIGAVNTITVRNGQLTGHNTDTTGFERALIEAGLHPAAGPIALIGAGGVGRAIGFALARLGVPDLRIVDRDPLKAEALAADIRPFCDAHASLNAVTACQDTVGMVNATPIGMLPDTGMPVPVEVLHSDRWVADVVYYPLLTPLLTAARAAGAKTVTGRTMTVHQAADAFTLFTGVQPSLEIMYRAFDGIMAART